MMQLDSFSWASALFVAAGAWGIFYWLTSDFLRTREGLIRQRSNRRRQEVLTSLKRSYRLWKFGGVAFFVLLAGLSVRFSASVRDAKELAQLHGRLYPADDPTPPNPCGPILKDDDVMIVIGTSAVLTSHFPHTILAVNKQPVIALDRDSTSGILSVVIDIRSVDGRIIVRLDKDGFIVNAHNYLDMKRPDKSTLIVYDEDGQKVVHARYANSRTFVLNGQLRVPGRGLVDLTLPGMFRSCVGHTAVADINLGPE